MRPLRTELSPVWDIEVDDNPPSEAVGRSPSNDSHAFDIDLDLT